MSNETIGFHTSLLGFNKKDVLACIDRLSAESLQAEQQAKEKMDALQMQLEAASAENEDLKTKTQGNTAVISRLLNEANEQHKQAQAVNEKCAQLETKVVTLDGQNQDFRRRLFQGEQESIALRKENDTLRQECTEKQEQIDRQNAQLAELKTTCETRLSQIHAENDARVAEAEKQAEARVHEAEQAAKGRLAQAEQELAQTQQELKTQQASPAVEKVSRSLAEVKQDLSAVEENVNRLSENLQRSMQMLEEALTQAEQAATARAVVGTSVPEQAVDATYLWTADAAAPAQAQARQPQAHAARELPPKSGAAAGPKLSDLAAGVPTVAERLLDKLAKLLEQ